MRDTIEMAREAGFKEHNGMVYVTTINDNCAEELKRFAELVRADERARLQPKKIKAVKEDDYCHGDERYYANE
jgi:hypothetical protein